MAVCVLLVLALRASCVWRVWCMYVWSVWCIGCVLCMRGVWRVVWRGVCVVGGVGVLCGLCVVCCVLSVVYL